MKKYTKRLKHDLKCYRVAKNYVAAALPLLAAFKVLVLHSSAIPIITAALLSGAITILGETLYYVGMSWVETATSIQENDNDKFNNCVNCGNNHRGPLQDNTQQNKKRTPNSKH